VVCAHSSRISESPIFSAAQHLLTVLAQRAVRAKTPLKGLARAVCVVRDDSGHKPKQGWWKIVAHSLDDE